MTDQLDWASLLDTIPETATQTRELIPPNKYLCTVEAAKAETSKTGNPKIEMTFVVADGEYTKRKVWGRINFAQTSPESMAVTISQLGEFGITRQWLALNNPTTAQIAARLVGQRISLQVSHREWQGQNYYDVRNYRKAPASNDLSAAGADSSVPF